MNRLLQLTFIRHGETNLNYLNLCQGHTDGKLTAKGLNQAKLLGQSLKNEKFDKIYCSDLSRAVDTCEGILKENNCFVKGFGRGFLKKIFACRKFFVKEFFEIFYFLKFLTIKADIYPQYQ